ncbi:hypothetical protein [Mucilaginibacter jinjuensis]|uniref:Uncharacterized protein n=1 Tax=Mucilaginibacter jinjuensis TaxID=1176721 RepID=A0ABY7TDP8_9SPHI|nr:hypothetical protein [Mucilaginibacter jinjuensis]WCT13752.1 hypothetical protein PQO05_07365 [Mucilaginibacter jinjuensis]
MPCIDNRGGSVHVYTSYFWRPMKGEAAGDNVYAKLRISRVATELYQQLLYLWVQDR